MATAGEDVHVWCPAAGHVLSETPGISVHRDFGDFRIRDLRSVGKQLDRFTGPRRILVQWVPHGYGYRAMNVPLCLWLLKRARVHGDIVEIMVHEPFLSFRKNSVRRNAVAVVHRLMTTVLLAAATRVWISIPSWQRRWQPYTLGRHVPFDWLPVPSNIPVTGNVGMARAVRERFPANGFVIGHFGTYGPPMAAVLESLIIGFTRRPHRINRWS